MTKAGLKLVGEIPEGCAEVIDATGVSKIVCETDKKACPIVDPSWETKCVEHNGIPEYKLDNNNCKFLECRFEKINETSKLWEKSVCPTPDENKEFVSQCQTFGGVASYIKKGGCNFVSCERKEQDKCINVDSLSPKILKDIEIKCSNQGLSVVRDYNANGCEILTCGDSENYCQSLSSEAYTQCKGELLVEKDSEGCVTFVQCVERGDTSVSLASHEKLEEVPDASILLGMVLRLEELKTKFLELSDKLEGIADFYEQKNDSNSERFQRASKLLLTASEEIEGVLDFLSDNIDALRVEDVEDIKIEIRRIRKVTLKDVLYIMLSTDNDVKQITSGEVKDCGADEDCFNFALRLCKPARMSPGEGVEALIVGLEEGNCIMDVSQSELGMTCKISKYSAGFSDPEKDILPFCEGELKEVMDNA